MYTLNAYLALTWSEQVYASTRQGTLTPDLGGTCTTSQITESILAQMTSIQVGNGIACDLMSLEGGDAASRIAHGILSQCLTSSLTLALAYVNNVYTNWRRTEGAEQKIVLDR